MNGNGGCPIWGSEAQEHPEGSRGGTLVDSPRAGGRYFITRRAHVNLRSNDEQEKARLTSWLVEQRRMGEECPEVTTKAIGDAERRRPLTVHERADRLLQGISSDLPDVAGTFARDPDMGDSDKELRLAWSECVRPEELEYLESYLMSRRWIQQSDPGALGRAVRYQISVEGHARLAELARTETESFKAFVAMWFDESMDDVWTNAVKPGIEDAEI